MNFERVDPIVKAVLYEGYILFPYHSSSLKNRQRWTFGGIYPRTYSEAQGGFDPFAMQTECLVEAGPQCKLDVVVRFLHLQDRQVGQIEEPDASSPSGDQELPYRIVETLIVGGQRYTAWQEAVEREVVCPRLNCTGLASRPAQVDFAFLARSEIVRLRSPDGAMQGPDAPVSGVIIRTQQAVQGRVEITSELAAEHLENPTFPLLYKVKVQITNLTPLDMSSIEMHDRSGGNSGREASLMRAFVSTHTLLGVTGGEFISLMDPPAPYRQAAAECQNQGTWPVLVGQPGQHDMLLSSPITLYDFPEVAPESPGDLFDGTEIDELLALNILTLTDEEKRAIRETDERGRRLLERTEALDPEMLARLHGAIRGMRRSKRVP